MTLSATEASSRDVASRPRRGISPLGWAVVALIAIPTAVFVLADVFGGHLLLSGDNLIQTYPLRSLVGADLRSGVLPGWDPWIWSGTPLLAGLNAGAFYPATFLFVVINPHAAWIIGEIFIYSSIGVGCCLLFSDSGMSPLSAFFGAGVFAFGGAVLTQASVHTDMADGLASLPWVLLAVRRFATDGRWRWSILFGGAFACTILAGAPEAMLDIAILAVAYVAVRISPAEHYWRRVLTRGAVGLAIAAGLTAAMWLPAVHFIAASQRATSNMAFDSEFGFPSNAALLGLVPFLEGGAAALFSKVPYFGRSNLGEVGFYIGILPLIAALSMWTRPWRDRLPQGERRRWYLVMAVGAVLAIVPGTPLERVFYYIPIYGQQRNAGRNIIDVDLAAAALFGWWVEATRRRHSENVHTPAWAAFLPLALVTAVGCWFALAPASLWRALFLHSPPPASSRAGIGLAIGVAAGLTAVGGVIAFLGRRFSRQTFLAAVGVFAAVDLALFAVGSAYAASTGVPKDKTPVMAIVASHLSSGGRYGVYDPNLFGDAQLPIAGEANVGILDKVPSVSGYGAIVDSSYSSVTGTHVRANLEVASIEDGSFAPLGIQEIVTVPEAFLLPVASLVHGTETIRGITQQANVDPVLPWGSSRIAPHQLDPMIASAPRPTIRAGRSEAWYFGELLHLDGAELSLGKPVTGQLVRVGVIQSKGKTTWLAPQRLSGGKRLPLDVASERGVGLVVSLVSGRPLGPIKLLVSVSGRPFLVAGSLTPAVTPGTWTLVGAAQGFSVYRFDAKPLTAWVQPATISGSGASGGARQATTSAAASAAVLAAGFEYGTARVDVQADDAATVTVDSPSPGILVWSTAYDPGWHAVELHGADPVAVRVRRVGLVLGVPVSKGTTVVRFSYEPVGFSAGVGLSLATLAALFAWGALWTWRRRVLLSRPSLRRQPDAGVEADHLAV